MKKLLSSLFFSIIFISLSAQPSAEPDIAKTFMRQGDYANAILVLNRVYENEPSNLQVAKDLSLCYYYQQNYDKALSVIKPLLDNTQMDEQCYQIAANIYLAKNQLKETAKVYKAGLKKFPESGALYNDYGELQWKLKDLTAIKNWEKGIETDPAFPKNYYNAARYYYLTPDKVWCLIYGEIFVNMEPNSARSAEIKEVMLESYKKLFMDIKPDENFRNPFSKAFLNTMQAQTSLASSGINTESLVMIRTRFILDWYKIHAKEFPFRLFDFHRQLLQEGLFEAYNHWLFTSVTNLSAYQNWINTHQDEYNSFDRLRKNIIFRMPPGQFYNK